ncbi:MAG: hypothetical protein LUQ65_09660 [Candidatus Helarchaeota archaeon]|nr:hypothetical protein [Candidatus Helarchaeota archaeon]
MKNSTSDALVAIVGSYYIEPKARYLENFEELAISATSGLMKQFENQISLENIDSIFLSSATASEIGKVGQVSWESIFASNFGINIGLHTFSKGSEALHHLISEISSRCSETGLSLVVGCDKKSDEDHSLDISNRSIDPNLRLWNWKWQNVYACLASKYLYETNTTHDDLITMAINDKYNSLKSSTKTLKDFLPLIEKSEKRLLFDPLTMDDFAPNKLDGAAALLLCPAEKAYEFTKRPVFIKSSASITSSSEYWNQENTLSYPALIKASEIAYRTAKLKPEDIDLVSVDTKATIVGPLALEGVGLLNFPALRRISENIAGLPAEYNKSHIEFDLDSGKKLIINPCGSTHYFGNIPGVSGLYRLIALSKQLTGEAENQVDGKPKIALLQEQSAAGMKQMVTILEVE